MWLRLGHSRLRSLHPVPHRYLWRLQVRNDDTLGYRAELHHFWNIVQAPRARQNFRIYSTEGPF